MKLSPITIVPIYMTMLMMATHMKAIMKAILGRFMFICVGLTLADMSCSFMYAHKPAY